MLDPPRPWKAWFDLSIQGMRLGWEAQNVIALRLTRLGFGHSRARSEARRMVREKFATLAEGTWRSRRCGYHGRKQPPRSQKDAKRLSQTSAQQQAPPHAPRVVVLSP